MDWGAGRYETTADRLVPAALEAVEAAALRPGERVVDVGCGTGNAALLAAERGCEVIGVDPASRLLDVARERGGDLDVSFLEGIADALPLADDSADAVLSVFAAIFAPDATAAIDELVRVTAPGGRIVLTAWVPAGPINAFVGALRSGSGAPSGPPRFAWHDADALAGEFGRHGMSVDVLAREISFHDQSPRAYLEGELREHPMAVAMKPSAEATDRALAVLEAGNEDPDGFRVTSPYVIAIAR